MNIIPREPKPLAVKLTIWAIVLSIVVPFVLSMFLGIGWQIVGLLAGCFWLFVCGVFTTFKPLPIARWFARPGTYELMLKPNQPAFTRWFLRLGGVFMMLVALFVGSMFWFTRNPLPAGTR